MSHAPLPSLRSLWAHAAAPAAFIRADNHLADRLGRLARTADPPHALAETSPYARLVAAFSFSDVLGDDAAEPFAPDTPVQEAHSQPDRFGRGAPHALPHRRPTWPVGADDPAWSALPPSRDAARDPAADVTTGAEGTPARRSAADGRPLGGEGSGADAPQNPAPRSAEQTRGAPSSTVPPSSTLPPPSSLRKVGVVRCAADAESACRIGELLAAAAPEPCGSAPGQARGEAATSEIAPADSAALLGDAVRRVEQRFAAASLRNREDGDNGGAAGALGRVARARARNVDVLAVSRTAWGSDSEGEPPRSVGLRGLAERVGPARAGERAPFFTEVSAESEDAWPTGALDDLAGLFAEAARHEGVDLDGGEA